MFDHKKNINGNFPQAMTMRLNLWCKNDSWMWWGRQTDVDIKSTVYHFR